MSEYDYTEVVDPEVARRLDREAEQREWEDEQREAKWHPKPTRPHRAGRAEWAATKRVFASFGCQVCGAPASELHHILSRDGDGTWPRGDDYRQNLAALCPSCHRLITERDMDTRHRLRERFTKSQLDYLRRRIGRERVGAYLARHYPDESEMAA